MTAPKAMDRARLAAFVDGELSPEDSAAVVMHLADHPADQAYVDDLFAANAALATLQAQHDAELATLAPVRETIAHAPDTSVCADTDLGRAVLDGLYGPAGPGGGATKHP